MPQSFRSPLRVVRGLGCAKAGTHHWWMQRVTALALVPLTLWLVPCLVILRRAPYEDFIDWVAQPLTTIPLLLFLGASFYHLKLGLRVVIEDYVHNETRKMVTLILVNFAIIALGTACIFSVLKISL